jgi:hypothetical protein
LPIGVGAGYAEGLGCFFDREAGKVAKVHDVGGFRIYCREPAQGLVEIEQTVGVVQRGRRRFLKRPQ